MPVVADTSALKPLEAGTSLLGTHTVSVYYTVGGETYRVVTTIAPDSDTSGAPIRLIVFLPPGEKQVISVGSFGTTADPETLELVHQGTTLSATLVPKTLATN